MKFFRVIFWEFVQNLPLVIGFVLAFQFWKNEQWSGVLVAVIGSSILGPITIRATEPKKIHLDHHPPVRVLATNILVMALLMTGLIAYLLAPWSNWMTDVLVGILAASLLGTAQSVAAKEPISLRHCAAFAFAFPLALISFRTLLAFDRPAWENILIITSIITLIISVVDYGPPYLSRARSNSMDKTKPIRSYKQT
jgi:hypothetical protein